ncbi:MAG: hypothetical protein QXO67_02220 [Candidatus Bathyarchaeia archaeon]
MHYCKVCYAEFVSFKKTLTHCLMEHPDKLSGYWIRKYQEWLKRKWTCNDCIHAGTIYFNPCDEYEPEKKACPQDYLFNHPSPDEECPNFVPKEYEG